jgi:hypothetical protein
MRKVLAFVILMTVGGCAFSQKQTTGIASTSPSGHYAVTLENSKSGLEKSLIVRENSTKRVVVEYQVERGASLVFSPSEETVVVVDNFASNENRLSIFDLKTNYCQMVGREIGQLDPASRDTMLQYSHVYFRDVRWMGNDTITCFVDVYDPLLPNVGKPSMLSLTTPVKWAWRKSGVMRSATAIVLPFAQK